MSAFAYEPDDDQDFEAEVIELVPPCTCGYEGPDEFGNYDLLEDDECPRHGSAS